MKFLKRIFWHKVQTGIDWELLNKKLVELPYDDRAQVSRFVWDTKRRLVMLERWQRGEVTATYSGGHFSVKEVKGAVRESV